jgi:hypothetical protein
LQLDQEKLGADHPKIGMDLTQLGSLQRRHGELDDARCSLERALQILSHSLPEDHPAVVTARQALLE